MSLRMALLQRLDRLDPDLREILWLFVEEIERQNARLAEQVSKAEFNELKQIVATLVQKVQELAEAQKRTERRVEELAEAQKRTERRVEELAEAQKRTERRVEELAEAQKRTEATLQALIQEVRKLAEAHRVTRDRLEALYHVVAFTLEDRAMKSLPGLLAEHGIEVEGELRRRYLEVGGKLR